MQIKHKYTGAVIYEDDAAGSMLELVEMAAQSGVDLRYANLIGANLSCADLRGVGLRNADLRNADLRGVNLADADLRSADLRRADLRDADLPHPIYQFYLGKYPAVAQPDELRIGCEVHSWEYWLENYEEIGEIDGMSDEDIEMYGDYIRLTYKHIRGNK